MKNEVTPHPRPGRIELDKRQGAPFIVHSDCPECGHRCKRDLTKEHLSYPVVGKTTDVYFTCDKGHEDAEWQVPVIVNITVTLKDP